MSDPFRLALLSYNYAPEPTGIPAFNTAMAEWLVAKRSWQVTVFTGIPHYPWWKVPAAYAARDYRHGRGDEIINVVEVRRVRHFVPQPAPSGLARMRLDASWLWRTTWRVLTDRGQHDMVMVVAPPFLSGFLGLLAGWWWRCPVVYHIQDLQVDAARDLKMLPRWLIPVLGWLEKLQLRRVDLVTTICRGMQRRVAGKTATRRPVGLMPNWADCSQMEPWDGPNAYRAAWNVAEDDVVIAYSGNLGRKQGLEYLIAAFALLADLTKVQLVIAGDGAERAGLERLAEQRGARVRFMDLVPADRLREFIAAADIHCVPQLRAAAGLVMPSKLLNLMALERPVVVTADPETDLAQAVSQAGCGLVVTPEDAPALAAALRYLVSDPQLRAEMGPKGRAHVLETYDIEQVLGSFAQQMRRLAMPEMPVQAPVASAQTSPRTSLRATAVQAPILFPMKTPHAF